MKPATYRRIATLRPAFVGSAVKRLLHIQRRVAETQHGSFYLDPVSNLGFTILENGCYEPEVTRAMQCHLSPSSTFVDLGANEGYHTVIGSKLAARVFAIEPQERLRPVIKKNLELNQVLNVTVIPLAISDSEGEATFYLYPSTNTGASGLIPALRYPVPTVKVKTDTLVSVFNKHGISACDLLKIDVEGAEHSVIFGSQELFQSHRVRALILEPSQERGEKQGHTVAQIEAFLTSCGYKPDARFEYGFWRQVWVIS